MNKLILNIGLILTITLAGCDNPVELVNSGSSSVTQNNNLILLGADAIPVTHSSTIVKQIDTNVSLSNGDFIIIQTVFNINGQVDKRLISQGNDSDDYADKLSTSLYYLPESNQWYEDTYLNNVQDNRYIFDTDTNGRIISQSEYLNYSGEDSNLPAKSGKKTETITYHYNDEQLTHWLSELTDSGEQFATSLHYNEQTKISSIEDPYEKSQYTYDTQNRLTKVIKILKSPEMVEPMPVLEITLGQFDKEGNWLNGFWDENQQNTIIRKITYYP